MYEIEGKYKEVVIYYIAILSLQAVLYSQEDRKMKSLWIKYFSN